LRRRTFLLAGASALLVGYASRGADAVVRITARRFAFEPETVTLRRGDPVVLELLSIDRTHGFSLPDFGLAAILPGNEPVRISFRPDKVGSFVFTCDQFCGEGHDEMGGTIVVTG
jgi:cytochrome c oxidase subunit 2